METLDLTNQRYGKLVVLYRTANTRDGLGQPQRVWVCRCDCGREISIRAMYLRRKLKPASNCGCVHGNRIKHPLYTIWNAMISRCEQPSCGNYKNYGARGISICARWRSDFWAFVSDMGERQTGFQIDRINVNGNYEPKNCRWASRKTQLRNMRRNVRVSFRGELRTIAEIAEMTGLKHYTVYGFRRYGKDVEASVEKRLRARSD